MRRREVLRAGLGAGLSYSSAWGFAPKEFWNAKPSADWTDQECQELLTHSPWAKEPTTSYDAGRMGIPAGRSASTNRTRRGGGTAAAASGSQGDPKVPGKYQAVVRWESALPIREASHNESKDDPAANYILNVLGDLPMLGQASNDESESAYAHRLEMLKQYTKLEKKGDPIYLSDLRYQGKGANAGALFYFVRNDLITLSDRTVTFVTKLGPIDVKVKFPLHEMLYQGKLEL
jgi:hypothetical protein